MVAYCKSSPRSLSLTLSPPQPASGLDSVVARLAGGHRGATTELTGNGVLLGLQRGLTVVVIPLGFPYPAAISACIAMIRK